MLAKPIHVYPFDDQRGAPVRSTVHRYGIPPSVRKRGFTALRAARAATLVPRLLPGWLIIGTQRGGTTSLHRYIIRHPGVGSAFRKEVSFFDAHYERGTRWYSAHFPTSLYADYARRRRGSPYVAGEGTPYYLFHPAVPERVRAVLPDVRLVAVLRDPVSRAYSAYQLQRALGTEQLEFEDALDREPERLAGEEAKLLADSGYRSWAHRHHSYVARGMYAGQIERWRRHFGREQLLVLPSERLFAEPARTTAEVIAFLGLPPGDIGTSFAPAQNRTGTHVPQDSRARLAEVFREPNRRLYELVGEDFGWDS